MEKVATALAAVVKGIEGAAVENNTFCVSVHYRNVHEKVQMQLKFIPIENSMEKNAI